MIKGRLNCLPSNNYNYPVTTTATGLADIIKKLSKTPARRRREGDGDGVGD